MHNVLENIEIEELKKINLETEYKKALSNPNLKKIVKGLKIDSNILKNYTSILEECCFEYENCMKCNSIFECKNKVDGFCYSPINNNGNLSFIYKPCRYKKILENNNRYLNNIKFFNIPDYVKTASSENIYKTDKNRFKVINWLMDFLDDFESNKNCKGLYLHGNFGCGKTYLISAIFNELAKKNYKSSIIFWPEFVRQAFYDDFNQKFEYVKKVKLLLIDDIGAEGLNDWNRDEILCPLLQYRMDNNLTTFFTSNFNINELEQHLSKSKNGVDEVKAKRIISRIEQLTEDLELISKNLRK